MGAPALRTTLRQNQAVTPRLQHAVRLLQLSSLDFAQEVHDAMGRNPFLEVEEGGPEAPPLDAVSSPTVAGPDDGIAADIDVSYAPPIDETHERDSWHAPGGTSSVGSAEGDVSALDLVAADVGLRPNLRLQLGALPLPRRDHALACAIVESLDDDGYLRTSLDEIASISGMSPAVDEAEMQIALRRVQSLDPIGVAARDLAECLRLQLVGIEDAGERELAETIVDGHLQRLADHDVAAIARIVGRSASEVEAACERIRRLNPRPGWQMDDESIEYLTPDVIVRKVRGRWTATLNRSIMPRVRVNQTYAALFKEHRERGNGELAQQLQDARWTVKNVEQRFSTILMVAEAILERQQHFLEFGPMAMKPLGLREIAQQLGLHESTVSRVTNNKYMATPVGVFELKFFFSREMATANGGSCSATAIRGVIQGMLDAENPKEPLSDAQIARLLVRQGLKVARRTVTKYRQLLKVPSVERRRRMAAQATA